MLFFTFPQRRSWYCALLISLWLSSQTSHAQVLASIKYPVPPRSMQATLTDSPTSDGISISALPTNRANTESVSTRPLSAIMPAAPAERSITGTVTDEGGAALPGVSVVVKGTTRGTTTDADGRYQVTIDNDGTTLVFSFVGYTNQEVAVGSRSALNVQLAVDNKSLNEVVVVGYGTQNRAEVTNSIVSIDAKRIVDMPIQNAAQAMAGQLAGVTVQSASGSPGTAPVIRVRGIGSISAGNDPLYVVDGYPLSSAENFNQINPNDIQTIEVLKDAASAAIYGSRGGNGIVIVTTKRGTAGKTRFSFNATNGFDEASKRISLLNGAQYLDYAKEVFAANPAAVVPKTFNDPSKLADTDWQSLVLRRALNQNYQLTASGGSERVQYAVSGGYTRQQGIVLGTDFTRFTLRANLDAQLTPKLKLGLNLAPAYTDRNDRPVSTDQFSANYAGGIPGLNAVIGNGSFSTVWGALIMTPIMFPKLPNGDYNQASTDPDLKGTTIKQDYYSPLGVAEQFQDNTKSLRILGSLFLQYEIVKGLTYKINLGAESLTSSRNAFVPSYLAYTSAPTATYSNPNLNGIYSGQRRDQNYGWLLEHTLTYDWRAGTQHHLTLLAGYSAQKNTTQINTLASRAGSFSSDIVPYLSTSSDIYGSAGASLNTLVSAFFRVNYDYKAKYLLSAAVRRDGSSRFGTGNKSANFPSVSAAWRVSEEPFFRYQKAISELKLRASYGVTGNNNIGDFSAVANLTNDNYTFGAGLGSAIFGFTPNGYSNPLTTWETNRQTDVGLELGFLNNRIALNADVYERNTQGLLTSTPVSSLAGFSGTYLRNVGNVQNRGIELELTTRNTTGAFVWSTSANFSANRNRVTDYYKTGADYYAAVFGWNTVFQVQKGGSLGDVYGYVADGVFKNQAEVDAGPRWYSGPTLPGDLRYKDVSGPNGTPDGQITPDDRRVIANVLPKFTYGLTNTLSYKGFDLRVLLQGVQGAKIIYAMGRFLNGGFNGQTNNTTEILNRWRSETQPGDGQTPRVFAGANTNDFSSRYVRDGSFLRIRNVALGYNLPTSFVNRLHLQNARITLSAQNLYTFTSYFGYNPETSIEGGSVIRPNVDQGSYPLPRSYAVGLSLTF